MTAFYRGTGEGCYAFDTSSGHTCVGISNRSRSARFIGGTLCAAESVTVKCVARPTIRDALATVVRASSDFRLGLVCGLVVIVAPVIAPSVVLAGTRLVVVLDRNEPRC